MIRRVKEVVIKFRFRGGSNDEQAPHRLLCHGGVTIWGLIVQCHHDEPRCWPPLIILAAYRSTTEELIDRDDSIERQCHP